MKKIILAAFSLLIFISSSAQQSGDLAMRTNENKTDNLDINPSSAIKPYIKYTLESYGNSINTKIVFQDEHYLGDSISIKWNLFLKNYKRVYEQTVGLSGSTVEIAKPTVFNAVSKINNYYKKLFKNGTLSKETLIANMSHILDCANLLCYEDDTKKIEYDIKNAKDPNDILQVFKSIEIIYH